VPGEPIQITVLFFGRLREIAGCSQDTLAIAEPASLRQVFEHYAARFPSLHDLRSSVVMARNHEFSNPSTLLADRDEVALLPPVSGGSDLRFSLTRDPIDTQQLARSVAAASDGAVVTFEGIVRDNTKGRKTRYLEYEGYEPMALKIMSELGEQLLAAHAIGQIAMVHRLGRMEIGEASVAIAVSAPHRRPAFEAAQEAIDTLKRTVPIWKKEFFDDGEIWVEGDWDDRLRAQASS